MTKIKFVVWIEFLALLVGLRIEAFPEMRHLIGREYSTWLILIGGFVLFIGLIIAFRSASIFRKEQVADDWSVLIEGAQVKTEDVFKDTEQLIRESKAPNVRMKRARVAPGVIRSILGKIRHSLVTTETGNPRLKPHQLFLHARDCSNNLDVSRYLIISGRTFEHACFLSLEGRS